MFNLYSLTRALCFVLVSVILWGCTSDSNDGPGACRARDRVFIAGGAHTSGGPVPDTKIYTSEDMVVWTLVGNLPVARYGGNFNLFNGSLLYSGGSNGTVAQNSIYYSGAATNASVWQTWTGTLNIAMENTHAVEFNNKLWIIGGSDATSTVRDTIMNSSDGYNWTLQGATIPAVLVAASPVVFNSKLWLLGGGDAAFTAVNTIYYSSDGLVWNTSASTLPATHFVFQPVSFNGKLWIFGGYDAAFNPTDVIWSSVDGETWVVEGTLPNALEGHEVIVFKNKVWILGGFNAAFTMSNQVWSSSDGVTWNTSAGTLPVVLDWHEAVVKSVCL